MNSMREHNERTLDELIPQFESTHGPDVALGEASRWTRIAHIERLVEKGVDVNCRIGERRVTPLMMAGKKAAAKRLLELGADVNASDADGHTALMWIFIQLFRKHESLARVKLLLEYGADVSLTDVDGNTAYDHALKRSDTSAAVLLNPAKFG